MASPRMHTCIGFAYYVIPHEDNHEVDLHVALAISESPRFGRDGKTNFFTLGTYDGKRFGSKMERRHYFTRTRYQQDIEDDGGQFVAIVHVGYTEQPRTLLRDMLVCSVEVGPHPKFDKEDSDEDDEKAAVWDTKKWAGVALCQLVQRKTFIPCNGIENSLPSIFKEMKRRTEFVLQNWQELGVESGVSIFQIGGDTDEAECEFGEMVL